MKLFRKETKVVLNYKGENKPMSVGMIFRAKQIYDRKSKGETLESIRAEMGFSRVYCSKLYNWYKKYGGAK